MTTELPAGFVLDKRPAPAPNGQLPPGFVLDKKPPAPSTAPSEIPEENTEEPGYLTKYLRGIGGALSKAAEGDEALDGLKDLAQGAASVGSQIVAPVLAALRGPQKDETYAQSRERFVYRPEDRGAQGIAELPGAVLKPVGDVLQGAGKLAGGGLRALGAPEPVAQDVQDMLPDMVGLQLGAGKGRLPTAKPVSDLSGYGLNAPLPPPKPVAAASTPAEVARAAGFKVLPSQAETGGLKGAIGNVVEGLAGSGKTAQRLTRANVDRATALAKEDLGLAPDAALSSETFKALKEPHNKAYEAVGQKLGTLTPDAALKARIAKVGEGQGSAVTPNRQVAKLKDTFSKLGELPAAKVVQEVRSLRENAQANAKTPFGVKDRVKLKELGRAQQAVADILDDWIAQQAEKLGQPEVAQAYKAARVELAKINTYERATTGGKVSQQKITAAAKKGAPLTGRLKIIADVGEAFPDVTGKPRQPGALESAADIGLDVASAGIRPLVAKAALRPLLASEAFQNWIGRAEKNVAEGARLGEYFPPPIGNPAIGPRPPPPIGDPAVGPTPPPYERVEFQPTGGTPNSLPPEAALLAQQLAGDLGFVPELTGAADNLARAVPAQARIGSGSEGTVRPGATDVLVGNEPVARTLTPDLAESLLEGLPNRAQSVGPYSGPRPGELQLAPETPLQSGIPFRPDNSGLLDELIQGLGIAPENVPLSPDVIPFVPPRTPPGDLAGGLELVPEPTTPSLGGAAVEPALGDLLTQLDALAEKIGLKNERESPFDDNGSRGGPNSTEARRRAALEKAAGQTRYRFNDRTGERTPLTGVDAVDAVARPGEVILQKGIGENPYSFLDRGEFTQQQLAGILARFLQGLDQ